MSVPVSLSLWVSERKNSARLQLSKKSTDFKGLLQDNGGFTFTQALLTDSPAIDGGNPDFEPPPEFDQRGEGFERILDGDADLIYDPGISARGEMIGILLDVSPDLSVSDPSFTFV